MTAWAVKSRKWFHRFSLGWITKLLRLFSKVVPYRLGVWGGGLLGGIAYYVLPRQRNRALKHLTSVFAEKGQAWIRRTARRSFVHLGKTMLETTLMTPRRLFQYVHFDDAARRVFRRALDQGRGVVAFTGHIGNWELTAAAVAAEFSLSVVAAPLEPHEVNDMIIDLRTGLGVRTIVRDRPGAARELIRVFKENRVLGILIDQDTDVDGAFVDFMGRPAWTPTAAAQMAIKFGTPVVLGYGHRDRKNNHTVTAEGPFELMCTNDKEKDIRENTAMFTKKLEDAILKHPEQWVWMHRRWRRQP